VAGVAEGGVVVERHLAVQRDDLVSRVADQRVHLDQRGVLGHERLPQLDHDLGGLVRDRVREPRRGDDLLGLGQIHAGERVDRDLRERIRALHRELLDVHAALRGGHRQERAVGAVEQEGEVVLLGDARRRGDEHPADDVALDVQAEDGFRLRPGVGRVVGQLHPAGLAPPAGLHLRLDDDCLTQLLGDRAGLVRSVGHLPG
jgi:hypothetical protein